MSALATLAAPAPLVKTPLMASPNRVLSVDMLRGITIALMILVNDPGDWEHVFSQLDHAKWNGWTLTDLVFPTFLFLMGASMVFSTRARAERGDRVSKQAFQVLFRAAKIFALSLFLSYFPRMNWSHMRLFGVLTRIALCYGIAGLILLASRRAQVIAAVVAALLLGYWVVMRWVPVPGFGLPVRDFPLLDPVRNMAASLDRGAVVWLQRTVHAGRLYNRTHDPEGLLSTLPAVATTLLGALAGIWMKQPIGWRRVRRGLLVAGVAGVVAGAMWGHWFPINKNLWTSSYVILSAGWAALALAACSALVDGREDWPRWLDWLTWPWFVFGSNAIAAFTVSTLIVEWMIFLKVTDADGDKHSLWELYYDHVFARSVSNEWTSLAFAVAFVIVCFVPIWVLWRKRIFLRL